MEVQGNIAAKRRVNNVHCVLFEQLTEIVDREPHDAALNMAIDEVLLRHAATPQLRIYRWRMPAVSFGYFIAVSEVISRWPQREMVRRMTGGGVVPHGDDVTYTLVVPRAAHFFSVPARESYRMIHEHVARLFAGAHVSGRTNAKTSSACFENPVEHDLLVRGRKIAGAAQRRTRDGLLHQGSIQCVQAGAIVGDVSASLARLLATSVETRTLSAGESAEAERLARCKYRSEAWLRRC